MAQIPFCKYLSLSRNSICTTNTWIANYNFTTTQINIVLIATIYISIWLVFQTYIATISIYSAHISISFNNCNLIYSTGSHYSWVYTTTTYITWYRIITNTAIIKNTGSAFYFNKSIITCRICYISCIACNISTI